MTLLLSMWLMFTGMLAWYAEPAARLDRGHMDSYESLNIWLGAFVLVLLYVLIGFELTHRTLAALLCASMSIAFLAVLDERLTMMGIMAFVDAETLLLLFSMMILVAVLVPSGIFDNMALQAYKLTRGKTWPMINLLSLFTIISSMILDNVTTVILITPVIIRICELSHVKPVPVLMIIIFSSNLGGILTPIGDPPNIMIMGNAYLKQQGLTFLIFTMHLMVTGTFCTAVGFVAVRYGIFCKAGSFEYTQDDVAGLKAQLEAHKEATEHPTADLSLDEEHTQKIIQEKIAIVLQMLASPPKSSQETFDQTLPELEKKYIIRDKPLLIKGAVCLAFALIMFLLHSLKVHHLSYAWSAMSAMILYVIVAEKDGEFEHYLRQVEFATLLFFACLFVLMECLTELGLIPFVGGQLEWLLLHVRPDGRLPVAIVLIMWLCGLASAFVDNIPVAAVMMTILEHILEDLKLPMMPLVVTLVLSVGLGGNGTLIGASTNIVACCLAEQHGYKISFMEFFRLGAPFMLVTMVAGTFVNLLLYVVFGWR